MTKREKFLLIVVFLLFLGATGAAVYFVIQYLNVKVEKVSVEQKLHQIKNELELKKVEIEEKEKKIADLKKKLNEFKDKVQSLLREVASLKREKEDLIKELTEIKEEFADIDEALQSRNVQIARLKQELMRTRARLFEVEQYMRTAIKEAKAAAKTTTNRVAQGEEKAVSLGKIVIGPSQSEGEGAKPVPARVLSINKKYNFAIFALPRGVSVKAGMEVLVRTDSGNEFTSVIDTVRNNLVTMDVPKDLDMAIGETVQLSLAQ